jgi:hypothetical protein
MIDVSILVTTVLHVVGTLTARATAQIRRGAWNDQCEGDRGAVSLEQVLWFVAAGVSVAVIAAILWGKIRDEANTPINSPSAP